MIFGISGFVFNTKNDIIIHADLSDDTDFFMYQSALSP